MNFRSAKSQLFRAVRECAAERELGEVLVRTTGHAAAARALDNSEEVVRKHYSHIEAGELADQMTNVFEQADSQQPSGSRE